MRMVGRTNGRTEPDDGRTDHVDLGVVSARFMPRISTCVHAWIEEGLMLTFQKVEFVLFWLGGCRISFVTVQRC